MQPLVSPILGRLDINYAFFFVPYRILDSNFSDGITGYTEAGEEFDYTFPSIVSDCANDSLDVSKYSVGDYLGYPLITFSKDSPIVPSAYPNRALRMIWNEWFRDENLQDPVKVNEYDGKIFNVSWTRDYFTSALLIQQKGTAPSFPVSGALSLLNINDNPDMVYTLGSPLTIRGKNDLFSTGRENNFSRVMGVPVYQKPDTVEEFNTVLEILYNFKDDDSIIVDNTLFMNKTKIARLCKNFKY